eukprot:1658013-Pleurochrysis_carterae.AAC.1
MHATVDFHESLGPLYHVRLACWYGEGCARARMCTRLCALSCVLLFVHVYACHRADVIPCGRHQGSAVLAFATTMRRACVRGRGRLLLGAVVLLPVAFISTVCSFFLKQGRRSQFWLVLPQLAYALVKCARTNACACP